MATRSKARIAAAAAGDSASAMKHVKVETTASGEDKGSTAPKSKATRRSGKGPKVKVEAASKVENCTCTKGDDGTPMVVCGECHIWFHFTCVNLAESDAEDLAYFVCPSCILSTGLRSIRTWEGKSAFEEAKPMAPTPVTTKTPKPVKPTKPTPAKKQLVVDESEDEESSEDEYVARDRNASAKRRRVAVASGTESDSSGSEARPSRRRRLKKGSNSPAPSRPLDRKRKASHSEGTASHKRGKSSTDGSHEDPTRKYCLGKLEELFHGIFLRYPRVKAPDSGELVSKAVEEMTDEEKEALTQESKQYADDLEKAIFETYAEHDKGNSGSAAGVNYKDRFRTLQFNLSKPDRVVIHQRITSREISPKDLSRMSSTDLANEETKELIKIAEKEALAHSIIQKVVAPRAKMTHKGFEDIEFDGERVIAPSASEIDFDAERRREIEAEERRERERNARLRGAQRPRTDSMSVPPDSPTVAHNQGNVPWGAPPPVPLHALTMAQDGIAKAADESHEAELPLGDLINIDEEPSSSTETLSDTIPTTPTDFQMQNDPFTQTVVVAEPHQALEASPFTPTIPEKATFDLGALWSGPSQDEHQAEGEPNDGEEPMIMSPAPLSPPTLKEDDSPKDTLEGGMVNGDPEPDFDMFFEEQTARPPPPSVPVTVEAIPTVWTGKLSMPLDSTIPQETPMVARQIAGNILDPRSLLWQTLFPSDHLRIDGRVQVKKSTEYLTSMRLDARRELYAVAFTPATEQDEASFKALSDFLIQKDRHGLIFPWGQRPKEHHPGKELYIIPLKPNEPVPEYLELLDHKIPKQRQRDYLVGIWVLNKGKLAPPTPPPSAPATVLSPPVVPTPPFNNPVAGTPPSTVPFVNASTTLLPASSTPPAPVITPAINAVAALLPPAGSLPPGVDPNGLAAEVAALTPEQIQTLLRTLQSTSSTLSPAPAPSQPPGFAIGVPPAFPPFPPQAPVPPASYGYPSHSPPPSLPPASGRTWVPGPGASTSPYQSPPHYPLHGETSRHSGPPPPNYPPGDRAGPHHHRGGNREYPGGRGRGGRKGQQFDNRDSARGPVDSGWPRKQSYPPPHNQGGYDQGRQW